MSTEPVLEVLSFLASDAYKENETLIQNVLDQIHSWNGLQRIYVGASVDEEDLNRRWLILVWNKYEDHKSLMDDPIVYPKVLEDLGKCMAGEVEMRHARFSDNTIIALTSPITEIAKLQLKDVGQKTEFEGHMHKFMRDAHDIPGANKHAPFVFGETLEDSGSYIFIGGWDSKQAHLDSVKDAEGIKGHVEEIGDYTTYKVYHLSVRQYRH